MTRGRSNLALFGSRLVSSEGRRATDITLDGYNPVLPGAAKITLIVPRGGLEGVSLLDREVVCPPSPLATSIFLLGQVGPGDPINSCNHLLYGYDPDDIDSRGFGFAFQDFLPSYWAI